METDETFLTLRGGRFDGRQVCIGLDILRSSREEGLAIFTRRFLETSELRFDVREFVDGEEVLIYRWTPEADGLVFTGEVGQLVRRDYLVY